MRISINRLCSSHGRGGLEGDRPSCSLEHQTLAEVQHIASAPTVHRRSGALPPRYCLLQSEEVWRATGPPAPTTNIHARQPAYLPRSRPRTTEAGNSRLGTGASHRRGLEGDRPSCSHDQHSRAAACISPPLPAAHHRSRDTSTRYRARPAASSPQTRHFSVIFPEVTEESVISAKKTADSRDSSVASDRIRRNADSVKVTTPLPVLTMRLLRPRHFDELLKWPHGISLHAGSLGTPTLPS